MGTTAQHSNNVLINLWRWTKAQIIETVPDDIAACEFSCHKTQCTAAEWANCERRIRESARNRMRIESRSAAFPENPASQPARAVRRKVA